MEAIQTPTCPAEITPEVFYAKAEIHKHRIEDAILAVRVFGKGPAVVLIHGYPVHGYTWRKLLPSLASTFTCYVIDLPGLGDSDWTADTDFSFTAQARRLGLLFTLLNLDKYALIAHDTGATLARLVALLQPECVSKLVLINTEIPGHRPPWIRFYQFSAKLPLANRVFRFLLGSDWFLHSSLALGPFFFNKKLFAASDCLTPYIKPLLDSPRRMNGMLAYLKGIDWQVVDGLRVRHNDIRAETLFIWGEEDPTFPVSLGKKMSRQFKNQTSFIQIAAACLMPHEEKSIEVIEEIVPFLLSSTIIPAMQNTGHLVEK